MKVLIKSLDNLPPMPAVAIEVVRLLRDPNCDADDLARAIALDPSVSLMVLKLANSSFYGLQRKVTTIRSAIVVLGQKALQNLVLAVSLKNFYSDINESDKRLWEDAFGCALAARLVGTLVQDINEEEAFLAGLIRHLGKMVLKLKNHEVYDKVEKLVATGDAKSSEIEKRFFEFSHGEVGASILQRWNFPEIFVKVTLHHEDMAIDPVREPTVAKLVAAINLAEGMCRRNGIGRQGPEVDLDLSLLPATKFLGLLPTTLDSLESHFMEVIDKDLGLFMP